MPMVMQRCWLFVRKNALSILLYALILLLFVSPSAKSWFLQQALKTGLFNAGFDKKVSDKPHPGFAYSDLAGNALNTRSLKGKIVFINFWASWCPPCRAEMPSLNNLYNKLKADDRFAFIFINEDNDKAKASAYLNNNKYAIPIFSGSGEISGDLFDGSLPTTIVLNRKGEVILRHEGMADYDTDSFIGQLKALP